MGRNRRQQRLKDRRARSADSEQPASGSAGSGGSRGSGGPGSRGRSGGGLSRPSKPAWRETLDSWGGFTLVGAIALSVIVVGVLVWINRPGSSANDEAYTPRDHAGVQQSGFVLGDPDAPVRLIEFADFQCPFCHRFWDETEPSLVEEYVATGKVQIEFRNYAFIGSESQAAAEAAACAADQDRFWDFHDLLYLRQGNENSGVYSEGNLKKYARTIEDTFDDFDYGAWESCFDADTHEAEIQEQNRVATNQGITSTPTVLVNGVMIPGAQPVQTYRDAIDAALAGG